MAAYGKTQCQLECSRQSWLLSNVEAWELYAPHFSVNKWSGLAFVTWRWISALSFFILAIIMPVNPGGEPSDRPFIFLTYWGFYAYTISQWWMAGVSTAKLVKQGLQKIEQEEITWELKVNWVLHTISWSLSLTITLLYWALLYDGSPTTYVRVLSHGLHAVLLVFLELWINAFPIRALHFYMATIFGVVYVIFSVIYDFAGGSNGYGNSYIYPLLDWSEGASTPLLVSFGALFTVIVTHFIAFGLYKLKIFIYQSCCNQTKIKPPASYEPPNQTSDDNEELSRV